MPESFRGRVFAFEAAFNTLATAMSQVLVGVLIDDGGLHPVQVVQLVAASAGIVLGIWLAHFALCDRVYREAFARVERNSPEPAGGRTVA